MCVFVIREERNEEEGCGGEVEVPSGSEMRCEVALKVPHKSHCPQVRKEHWLNTRLDLFSFLL